MTRYNCVAVQGRIPFDDDDSILIFENCTREEACQQFSDAMYNGDEEAREADIRKHGSDYGVFIIAVLASNSPIDFI